VFFAEGKPMRLLFMAAAVILFQSNAFAGQMQLTFSMLDIDIEVRQGTSHMVEVSLDGNSKLRMQDHSLIPIGNGEYTGVVRRTLDDGTITVVLKLHQHGREYSGDYTSSAGRLLTQELVAEAHL
jgi:hypothetical protein